MRILPCFLFFLLIVTSSISVIADENALFRGFSWGTKKQEVKAREKAYFIQENKNGLMYEDQLFHRRFNTAYFFYNDQLYRGVYSLQKPFKDQGGGYLVDNKNYFILYNNIVNEIKEKYGQPSKEVSLPPLTSINVDEFLDQIERGEKTVLSQWNIGNVAITTALKGSKGKILVLKIYNYKPLLKQIVKAQKASKN